MQITRRGVCRLCKALGGLSMSECQRSGYREYLHSYQALCPPQVLLPAFAVQQSRRICLRMCAVLIIFLVTMTAVQSATLGPSVFTAPRAFPTSLYRSYYNDPTATTAQPQPIITDPVSVSFISDLPLVFSRLLALARTKSISTGSRIQRPSQG